MTTTKRNLVKEYNLTVSESVKDAVLYGRYSAIESYLNQIIETSRLSSEVMRQCFLIDSKFICKEYQKLFLKNPTTTFFNRLQKAMLAYQNAYKNIVVN